MKYRILTNGNVFRAQWCLLWFWWVDCFYNQRYVCGNLVENPVIYEEKSQAHAAIEEHNIHRKQQEWKVLKGTTNDL